MAVVYGLRAKGSDQYFYIGCTGKTAEERWNDHRHYMAYNSNRHFVNKVNKIGAGNVVVDTLEVTPVGQQFVREEWWIKHLTASGTKLTNLVHNGFEMEWKREARKYSLKANWEWALRWYKDYQAGFVLKASRPEHSDSVDAAQSVLAEVMRHILSAPAEEQQALIEKYS